MASRQYDIGTLMREHECWRLPASRRSCDSWSGAARRSMMLGCGTTQRCPVDSARPAPPMTWSASAAFERPACHVPRLVVAHAVLQPTWCLAVGWHAARVAAAVMGARAPLAAASWAPWNRPEHEPRVSCRDVRCRVASPLRRSVMRPHSTRHFDVTRRRTQASGFHRRLALPIAQTWLVAGCWPHSLA